MKTRRRKSAKEPTIALINVVFLMLVFFMVAGTLAPPLETGLNLVSTGDLDGSAPPDALVVHPDGRMSYRGTTLRAASDYLALRASDISPSETSPVRVVPDRDLPAARLIQIARDLRLAGADRVVIVTEKGLQ